MTLKFSICLTILGLSLACASPGTVKNNSRDGFNPLSSVINVYTGPLDHLSAVRRSECPMYPSCSTYGKQCIKKHGLFIGWVMTCDRLIRCGRDEMKSSPLVLINGKWKYYDPVQKNDFWWSENPQHIDQKE